VDGLRIAYGYYPGLGADTKCTETGGFDELRELCERLLQFVSFDGKLWGAQVNQANVKIGHVRFHHSWQQNCYIMIL
jgi:hypothetical protein